MAQSTVSIPVSQGYVSGRDPSDLQDGELLEMQNAYYKPGDPRRVWRKPGRTAFGTVSAGTRVKSVALCQFDDGGTDKLLAYSGTTIYGATPGTTGTFASLVTGLTSDADHMSVCHDNDRWFIGNGFDTNKVLMPDGTVRAMGMAPNLAAPTVLANSSGSTGYPTVSAGGAFTNPALSYDGDETSSATMSTYEVGGGAVKTQTWSGWSASAAAGRKLTILYSVGIGGSGGWGNSSNYFAITAIQVSEDSGATWTDLKTWTWAAPPQTAQIIQYNLTANSSLVQFRIMHTPGNMPGALTTTVYANEVSINVATSSAAFNMDLGGLYYAVTEYYEAEDLESAIPDTSPFSALVAFGVTGSTSSSVTVTRPDIVNKSTATHWRVYRTPDGAAKTLSAMGLISGDIPISQSTFVDDFIAYDKDSEGASSLALVAITSEGGTLNFPRDLPPPAFRQMVSWKGAICGLTISNPRSWFFSVQGFPESWPDVNVNSAFPLAERDELIAQMPVGETMVFLAKGAVLATDNLPSASDNNIASLDLRVLRGQPGCVGERAFCTFSVEGEPRGAWISPFGVHITNGNTTRRVSDDIDWENEVQPSYLDTAVLTWDPKNLVIWMQHDSDGDGQNDRETPIHVGENHQKQNGMPKWGQPTAKATSDMVGGLVGSTYLRYSGHPSDGVVYVEESGGTDESADADPDMVLTTGQMGSDGKRVNVLVARVRHSDFGDAEDGILTTTVGVDSSQSQMVRADSISLDGERTTEQFIARAGNWMQFSHAYSGTVTGAILGFEALVESPGLVGTATRL